MNNEKKPLLTLTDAAANSEWGCNNSGGAAEAACGQHKQAVAEAEAAQENVEVNTSVDNLLGDAA